MSKKIPWDKKYKIIVQQYPNVDTVDWRSVLQEDGDIFARLLGDVLKSESRGSKPGKRPQLDRSEGLRRLSKISGEDFSEYSFLETFQILTRDMSIRQVASKTGLGKSHVQRLLQGDVAPTFEAMEIIARSFHRNPSYFLEYRVARVIVAIDDLLSSSPETATTWYLKLKGVEV